MKPDILNCVVSYTAEEALATKELIDEDELADVILVKLSFHMPRAKRLFDHVGVRAQTFPQI